MSFLKTSLEKRIKELHASIEAQKTELAAYEQVLALESGKPAASVVAAPASAPVIVHRKTAPAKKTAAAPAPAAATTPINVEFNGSRSDFVASVIQARGASGVTPIEISKAFADRKIAVSKNLVYNVLSLMNKQKKVRKVGGVYFALKGVAKVAAPIVGNALVTPKPAAAPKKKRRISEEGMRRIIAATKKRWAAVRAAKAKAR